MLEEEELEKLNGSIESNCDTMEIVSRALEEKRHIIDSIELETYESLAKNLITEELSTQALTIETGTKGEAKENESDALLKLYANAYGKAGISSADLILCAAAALLESWGAGEQIKYNLFDECIDIRTSIIDGAIHSSYGKADHGSKSAVMSISEKYTWEARYALEAYFSLTIPYTGYFFEEGLDDYLKLDNFPNPIQEYYYYGQDKQSPEAGQREVQNTAPSSGSNTD